LGIDSIGNGTSWRESALLVAVLLRDPSSWSTAVYNQWSYPVSREWIVATHTYDLHATVNAGKGRKPKPYPNPFPNKDVTRTGKTDKSPEEVKRLLATLNPKE